MLGAKPFSPMTLLRAWIESFRAPALLLLGGLLVAAQLVSAHLPAGIAAHGGSLTLLRLAAFLPLFFSAWRISAAITRVESDVR